MISTLQAEQKSPRRFHRRGLLFVRVGGASSILALGRGASFLRGTWTRSPACRA